MVCFSRTAFPWDSTWQLPTPYFCTSKEDFGADSKSGNNNGICVFEAKRIILSDINGDVSFSLVFKNLNIYHIFNLV